MRAEQRAIHELPLQNLQRYNAGTNVVDYSNIDSRRVRRPRATIERVLPVTIQRSRAGAWERGWLFWRDNIPLFIVDCVR